MVLSQLLQQPFAQTLASALEHFVWEGAVLGLALFALVRFLKPAAHARYLMGVACLAAMALAPVVTAAIVSARGTAGAGAAFTTTVETVQAGTADVAGRAAALPRWNAQALVVSAWLIGVLALSLRLGGGWVMTRRLVTRSRDRASAEIRWLADRIGHQLALGRQIEIFESPTIVVPVLIGWMAPVVILPTAALSGLAPAQLEALIAHELAHVRRHDYLVNLLQSVVETLLFFHPAVWWVSRDVRETREHCCDDLVVGLCDRVVYASALADLAALVRGPRFALAATDGSLVSRVRRILGGKDDGRPARQEWIAAAILALLVVGTVPITFAAARGSAVPTAPPERLAAGLQEPAVAIRQTPQGDPAAPDQDPASMPVVAEGRSREQRIELDQPVRLLDNQDADVRVIELKLQRELEELSARPEIAQDVQDRQAELKAALERLRAMLEERQATDRQLQERRIAFEEIQTKLAALERQIAERKGSLDGLDQKRMAEAKAKLEKAKAIDLDSAALAKLKAARIREAEEQMATAQALMKRQAQGEVEAVAKLAKMKEELARQNDVFTFKLPEGRVIRDLQGNLERLKADKDGNVVMFAPAFRGGTDFDPKEIQAVLAPAFDAGPNDVSVVGRVVKHPGRVEWHDGLTVAAALKAAGAPPISNEDNVVRRLSQLQVTFGAGGPRVNGRVDDVNADTVLRPGDVIVVSPRVKK